MFNQGSIEALRYVLVDETVSQKTKSLCTDAKPAILSQEYFTQ